MTATNRGQRIRTAVLDWWDGEYVFYENDPNSSVVLIGGYVQRHWTSSLAHTILGFLGREWKWVAGFTVAVASLCIAFARLP